MALVVDASVGLKWMMSEPDSYLAEALARTEPDLLVPDFWLNKATNVLWLQVRRKLFTPEEAREALAQLRAQVEPTPTTGVPVRPPLESETNALPLRYPTLSTPCYSAPVKLDRETELN